MTTLIDRPSGSASGRLSDELVRLREVMERTGAQLAARRRDGLDKAAYAVLFHLATGGPRRSGALAETMLTDPSTISRHVAQLVDRGLVARTADPDDGRATVLAVTDLGRRTAAEVRQHRRRLIQVVVSDWDPAQTQELSRLIGRFVDDLERHRPTLLADVMDDPPRPDSTTPGTLGPEDPA